MGPIFKFFFNKVVVGPKNSAWTVPLSPTQCNQVHKQCQLLFIRAKKKKKKEIERKNAKRENAQTQMQIQTAPKSKEKCQ